MKSRIVVLLSVTLAALLLVVGLVPNVMPTSPVIAQYEEGTHYMYSVPFICGYAQNDCDDGVKPANYATLINIHNYSINLARTVHWKVTRSLPKPIMRTGWRDINIPFNASTALTCKNIMARLGINCAQGQYVTGFVVIECMYELDVYVTYTTEYYEWDPGMGGIGVGLSIDTEGPIEPTTYVYVG